MELRLTEKQYRRLLDLVYIGNWILNSTRGDQRFADYDEVESLIFGRAALEDVNPRTSWRASKEFRIQLVQELSARALREAARKGGAQI